MTALIEGVRSVPVLLQMFFIFFGLPALGIQMPVFLSAALAMTLWMAANLAEVIRGAIESIPRGQLEAASSTGLTYGQAMRSVIVPQALRRMLPPFVGLCTILIKDTSLAAIIGVFELTRAAQETIERTFRSFELYVAVAAIWLYPDRRIEKLISEGVAFFVARQDGEASGCGGVQLFGTEYAEIKRMYVRTAFRGRGLGKAILNRLAEYALDQGVTLLRLETGIHQKEAIELYERFGFVRIKPFGEYWDDPLSLFFEIRLD